MGLTPLQYLRVHLGKSDLKSFMAEWKALSAQDKTDLRQWAAEEMATA